MKLEIEQSLAQRLLDHLVSNPTGAASYKEVHELVQGIVALKPAAPPTAESGSKDSKPDSKPDPKEKK